MTRTPSNDSPPDTLVVGLAQIAPVWLDRAGTVAKVVASIEEAAERGCRLVAFGETLIPGYPFWLSTTGGASFNSDLQKDLHAHYLEQAVSIERGDLAPITNAARAHAIDVWVGVYERPADRGGHTGYASLVHIDATGTVQTVHRKLVPTYEERLSWGAGDGNGLRVAPIEPFTVGALNCWENWMPLARSALYAQGEDVHIAAWPGAVRLTQDITRFIALESRSWVLSVSGLLRHEDIPDHALERSLLLESLPEMIADGGSCIAGPDGTWKVEPVIGREELLVATLDHTSIRRERQNFDPSGHYSRPDVLSLQLDRTRQSVLAETPDPPAE